MPRSENVTYVAFSSIYNFLRKIIMLNLKNEIKINYFLLIVILKHIIFQMLEIISVHGIMHHDVDAILPFCGFSKAD